MREGGVLWPEEGTASIEGIWKMKGLEDPGKIHNFGWMMGGI